MARMPWRGVCPEIPYGFWGLPAAVPCSCGQFERDLEAWSGRGDRAAPTRQTWRKPHLHSRSARLQSRLRRCRIETLDGNEPIGFKGASLPLVRIANHPHQPQAATLLDAPGPDAFVIARKPEEHFSHYSLPPFLSLADLALIWRFPRAPDSVSPGGQAGRPV